MLKTAGHIKKYYVSCCLLFEEFLKRKEENATFKEFLKFVEKESEKFPDKDERRSFKGDMLEILAEIFFKAFANSVEVGITDYTPTPLPEDYGVDGKGINAAGTLCAVQVKYRGNQLDKILYAEVARTYCSGRIQLNLPLDTNDCIYIFTSAIGITTACETVFGKMLRVLNYDIISKEVDNNINFWEFAFNEVKETLLS